MHVSPVLKLGNLWERSVTKILLFLWQRLFVNTKDRVTRNRKLMTRWSFRVHKFENRLNHRRDINRRFETKKVRLTGISVIARGTHTKSKNFLTLCSHRSRFVSQLQNWTHDYCVNPSLRCSNKLPNTKASSQTMTLYLCVCC